MNIAIRYYTRSGNTQKLASAIAEAMNIEAKDVSAPLTEKADILFFGSSVYAGGVADAVKQFHCKGAFGIMHRNRPNEKDLQNVATFAKNVINK